MTTATILILGGLSLSQLAVCWSLSHLIKVIERTPRKLDDIMYGINFIVEQLDKQNNDGTERDILD